MALPASVIAESKDEPLGEDIALDILRRRLPGLRFSSLIEQDVAPPFVLIRTVSFSGSHTSDDRFLLDYYISAESFTGGLEADIEGPKIHVAIKNALKRSSFAHDSVLNGAAWMQESRLIEPARRKADWANSEGPVQYADLPQGYARFESVYRIKLKRAVIGPNIYDF